MLDGFDIIVTQKGHVFTVSGKDVEKLWKKLRTTPDVSSRFITGKLENGTFTLEKIGIPEQRSAVG